MSLGFYLSQPFAYHALIAATLIAIGAGLLGPFVAVRGAAFFVHGTAELAFTGAAAGLLAGGEGIVGALIGSLVIATVIGLLGDRARERDTAIGVVLAFGLGLGRLLLDHYHGYASTVQDILFGDVFGVSSGQILLLVAVVGAVLLVTLGVWRPLLFTSVDRELAEARGVPTRLVSLVFLYLLALTVTEAAQIVGTLLVLSLAITPAAAAGQLSKRPVMVALGSVAIALLACDGGLLADFAFPSLQPSVLITFISFGCYLAARLVTPVVSSRWRRRTAIMA